MCGGVFIAKIRAYLSMLLYDFVVDFVKKRGYNESQEEVLEIKTSKGDNKLRHLVLLLHVISVAIIAVSVAKVFEFHIKSDKSNLYFLRWMRAFFVLFLSSEMLNMILFYDYGVTFLGFPRLAYRIGWDLVLFLTIFSWIAAQKYIFESKIAQRIVIANKYFLAIYVTAWCILNVFVSENYSQLVMIFDNMQMLLLCIGIICSIKKLSKCEGTEKRVVLWSTVVSILFVNHLLIQFYPFSNPLQFEVGYIISNIIIIVSADQFIRAFVQKCNEKVRTSASDDEAKLQAVLTEIQQEFNLTEREIEILREVYIGKSNKEIASSLFISLSTVKTHLHTLFKKLDADSRQALITKLDDEILKSL